jgi:hypothetical protein
MCDVFPIALFSGNGPVNSFDGWQVLGFQPEPWQYEPFFCAFMPAAGAI